MPGGYWSAICHRCGWWWTTTKAPAGASPASSARRARWAGSMAPNLWPGTGEWPKINLTPASAVRTDGTLRHVFTVTDGRLEDHLVQVDDTRGGLVPVVSGIVSG